jgi:hypothetical protein
MKRTKKHADIGLIEDYAVWAYNALDHLPEFGVETRVAIVDTAGDALTGDGYDYDHDELRRIAQRLAG